MPFRGLVVDDNQRFLVRLRPGASAGRAVPAPDGRRVIMISTRADEDYAELMADTPAAGFLGKSALSVQAIRTLVHYGA